MHRADLVGGIHARNRPDLCSRAICITPPPLGTQTRTVYCVNSSGSTVSSAMCTGSKPSTSQTCNSGDCCKGARGFVGSTPR